MREIFISYASADQAIADRLVTALEQRGLSCWIASREIPPGESYQEQIPQAVAACKVVLVLYSKRALASREIPKELVLARKEKKRMNLLRIENLGLEGAFSYEFGNSQYVDLFNDFETAVGKLCVQLDADCQKEGQVLHLTKVAERWRAVRVWSFRTGLVATACVAIVVAFGLAHIVGSTSGESAAASAQPASDLHVRDAISVASETQNRLPLTDALSATPVLPQASPPGQAGSIEEQRARLFAMRYFAMLGASPVDALPFLRQVIAEPVRYFGVSMQRHKLIENQKLYFTRWPDRTLTVRPDSLNVECDRVADVCNVSGLYDSVLRSIPRRAGLRAVEQFSMQLSGSVPQVTALTGRSVEHHGFDPQAETAQ